MPVALRSQLGFANDQNALFIKREGVGKRRNADAN